MDHKKKLPYVNTYIMCRSSDKHCAELAFNLHYTAGRLGLSREKKSIYRFNTTQILFNRTNLKRQSAPFECISTSNLPILSIFIPKPPWRGWRHGSGDWRNSCWTTDQSINKKSTLFLDPKKLLYIDPDPNYFRLESSHK